MNVVLIQIDEAHSSAWPVGLKDQPEPQTNFDERIKRANEFIEKYDPPFKVLIDGWDNIFAETYRAWPDQYVAVDSNKKIIAKSEYGLYGDQEAKCLLEYTDLLESLFQ